jgi:hypothetical protein
VLLNLTGAQYEPSSAPDKVFLGGIKGLKDVWFEKEQQSGLVLLGDFWEKFYQDSESLRS